METTGAPHSSTACEAIGDRQPLIQDLVRIIDLAAAGAREVAAEQRLEHQHERIAFAPGQLLADDVGADARLLQERNGQGGLSEWSDAVRTRCRCAPARGAIRREGEIRRSP